MTLPTKTESMSKTAVSSRPKSLSIKTKAKTAISSSSKSPTKSLAAKMKTKTKTTPSSLPKSVSMETSCTLASPTLGLQSRTKAAPIETSSSLSSSSPSKTSPGTSLSASLVPPIGTCVWKMFGNNGCWYKGNVTEHRIRKNGKNCEETICHISYEDGHEEDLSSDEAKQQLILDYTNETNCVNGLGSATPTTS